MSQTGSVKANAPIGKSGGQGALMPRPRKPTSPFPRFEAEILGQAIPQ